MAATMRKICGCAFTSVASTLNTTLSTLSYTKNVSIWSLNKATVKCKNFVCVARLKLLMTSSRQATGSQAMPMFGYASVAENLKTRYLPFPLSTYSSQTCTIILQKSSNAYRTLPCRMICLCRSVNFYVTNHNMSTVKSESSLSRHTCTHSNMKATADDKDSDIARKNGTYSDKVETACENCSSKTTVKRMKENIMTVPNLLTTMRMASAPILGYLVISEHYPWALGLFVISGISDLLDGYIARTFPNQRSALGSAIDPLADKLLVTILTVSLTSVGLIPLPLTALIVFRDISLIAGGFYIRYRSLLPPITLSRYFDISDATVDVSPPLISKVNTGFQLLLVASSLAAPVYGFVDHLSLQVLWWITGTTTFLSGVDYLLSWKKYITLLQKDQREL